MKHVYPVRHPASLDVAAKPSTTAGGGTSQPRERDESGGGKDVAAGGAGSQKAPTTGKADDPRISPDRPRR